MPISKLTLAKLTINSLIGVSVAKVTNDIIANNVNEPDNLKEDLENRAGSFVVGGLVVSHISRHVNDNLDKMAAFAEGVKEVRREAAAKKEASTPE